MGSCQFPATKRGRALLAGLGLLLALSFAPRLRAQDFTVNSTGDTGDNKPGDGVCSTGNILPNTTGTVECTLRAAIDEANAAPGAHKITLPAGTYSLTNNYPCAASSGGLHRHYCMTGNINIVGAGASNTILDAARVDRVIFIGATGNVQISGVTIQNGFQTGGTYDGGGGGAINSYGSLSITDSVFTGNRSDAFGGGIDSRGPLTVSNSSFLANNGGSEGGGIFQQGSYATIENSTFTANLASVGGGLSDESSTMNILGCTFSQNSATGGSGGGGIFGYQTNGNPVNAVMTITNSTIVNNSSANLGGGLFFGNSITVLLNNDTVSGNTGGALASNSGFGSVTLQNSILAKNPDLNTQDCSGNGNTISGGHNLIGNSSGCKISGLTATDLVGQDPLLATLADNGGLTQTVALGAGSPAIDAGNPTSPGSGGTACVQLDQRGYVRPIGGACDIGAFETGRGLALTKMAPSHGGNIAPVVTIVTGNALPVGATIKLSRTGQADIPGTAVTMEPTGTALSAIFDITGALAGQWDAVLTTPDNRITTLSGAFTIGSGSSVTPKLWSQVIGRSAIRAGYPARYTILYGNNGDVDAFAVPLAISTPLAFQLNLYTAITPPPAQLGQVITDWSGVPVEVLPLTSIVNADLLIPVIPAGFQGSLEISLLVPTSESHGSTLEFSAALGDPFFIPTLDPAVATQMVAGAQGYAAQNLGVVPPASATGNIQNYANNQLELLVSNGRAALAGTMGIQSQYYSLGQLMIDAGEFAAAQPAAAAAPFAALGQPGKAKVVAGATTGGKPTMLARTPTILAASGHPGGTPTGGGILPPGTSGGKEPAPTTVPNPKDPPPPKGVTPGECRSLPNHHVSADGSSCVPNGHGDCAILQNPLYTDPSCVRLPIIDAVDPNDKGGAQGVSSQHYVAPGSGLGYTIYFENLATASAAAQQVVVTDQLDLGNLDASTFSFGSTSFAGYFLHPTPKQNHFVGTVDLRPIQNVIVKVEGTFDPVGGLITWIFTSLDPVTEMPTTDPLAGFLPPNTTPPSGEGRVAFDIMPRQGVTSNSVTCNQANVVFDKNPAILTPTWCNAHDVAPPVSRVQALPVLETSPVFAVAWSGTDAGSGIGAYNIYASDDGGTFGLWQSQVTASSAQYTGEVGHTYGFFSQAIDNVGNIEVLRTAADTKTLVGTSTTAPSITLQPLSQTITGGSSVTFTASASGTPAPTAQWQVSSNGGATFTNIAGATSPTLTFVGRVAQSGNSYQAVFTNSVSTAATNAVKLTVKPLLGDLNGDGLVNCADIAIVKASFGKKSGQAGFDPRADVNGDGAVNVVDLATVSRQLPAGTTCK